MVRNLQINRLCFLVAIACMILPTFSGARAGEGGGDSTLRAELQNPRLLDERWNRSTDRYLIGDPSRGYDQRHHAAKSSSTYTHFRE
jgi:hypothetical protein